MKVSLGFQKVQILFPMENKYLEFDGDIEVLLSISHSKTLHNLSAYITEQMCYSHQTALQHSTLNSSQNVMA